MTNTVKKTARKSAKVSIVRDIPLKTILNDIIAADKTRTLTTKMMRVVLRREFAVSMEHARNALWTFTAEERDIVRARFDAKFRAKLAKPAKAKKAPKVTAPVEPVSTDA